MMAHEEMATTLEKSGEYRILRRLRPREVFFPDDGCQKLNGIILDIETTGLDHTTSEIIELGMVKFEFASDGRIFRVLDAFTSFRQPSNPISQEITTLTGITNDMVDGRSIDAAAVTAFIGSTSIIIAHNAGFDRRFCEKFASCFVPRAWACSVNEIEWRGEGYEGSRLAYLLMGAGLFHNGHRADMDCRALLEILSQPLPKTGELALKRLLDNARKSTVRIWAESSPYDMKDILKSRGYHWNPGNDGRPKSWWRDLPEDQAATELDYLRKEIYRRDADIPTARLTAFDRYSDRA